MANDENFKDPFNWTYFFGAVLAVAAFPLLHVFLGWMVFYFNV